MSLHIILVFIIFITLRLFGIISLRSAALWKTIKSKFKSLIIDDYEEF